MLLAFCFFGLLLASTAIILLMTKPSAEQASMQKRIVAIKAAEGTPAETNARLEQYLATRPKSQYEWLETVVADSRVAESMQLLIIQANSQSTVGTVLMRSVMVSIGGAVGAVLFLHALPFAFGGAVLGGYLPVGHLQWKRARRLKKFNDALPDAIDMIARSLRAGHSFVAALSIVGEQAVEPARSEFGEVFKKQNYGLPLRDGLLQLLDRVPSQDLKVLVTGVLVQKDTGGNLVEILERIVTVIRERQRIQREISTHTAQGRMTGYILTALPLVMMFLINIVNPGYSNVLFKDPFGREMLYVGAGLLLVGGLVIRQIINGIEI